MRTKFAKVRKTDYRALPEAAGCNRALPGYGSPRVKDGLDYLADAKTADQQRHDKAVATLSVGAVLAAAKDLGRRRCWDYKDPEHRWSLGRLAALARRIDRERLVA